MTKHEKDFRIAEKIILGLIVLVLMAEISRRLYETVGEKIEEYIGWAVAILVALLIFVTAWKYIAGIYQGTYGQKAEKLWKDIIEGASSKTLLYLKNNRGRLPIAEVVQLMEIYKSNDEIFSILLEEAIRLHDQDESMVSFVLLEKSSQNAVASMLEENESLRSQCEHISKENVKSIKGAFDDLQREVSESKLLCFVQKLLHGCLPNNSISKEEIIEVLEYILGWIIKHISKENIGYYQESMSLFILILPAIKSKLNQNNVRNYNIMKAIRQVENSEWFKQLRNNAYSYIEFGVGRDEVSLIKNEKWLNYSCIISMYYKQLSFMQQMRILHKIQKKQRELYKEYDAEKVILFVLMASPIRIVKNDDDVLYNWLSIIYLCTSHL